MALITTIFEACKKRKRTPLISTFNNSGPPPPPPPPPLMVGGLHSGAFRDNIRDFLKHCSEIEDYTVAHSPVWCSLLLSESSGVVFPLYVVEDTIHSSHPRPLCDHCRCIGWSHHFVSKRRYHLIIPKDEKWNKPLTKESLDENNHLLHGLIHCNGFGHLLCINGVRANSKFLHGLELMNLWDHLCSILQTREISVEDLSKKAGNMDLRLLHGVAYGRTWFGKWGFKFSRGSFGVTQQKYERAIQILSSLDLSKIIHDFVNTRQGELVKRIVNIYRDASENRMITISDLFQFMLAFKSTPLIQRKLALALAAMSSKPSTHTAEVQPETCLFKDPNRHSSSSLIAKFDESRWPARRLNDVIRVILDTLEANGSKMDRQTLRDAVRQHIGDTGLIDFVIKNIDKVMVEGRIIRRAVNPVTRKLVISLQVVAHGGKNGKKMDFQADIPALEPGVDVNKDLQFLYTYVLLGYPDSHSVSVSTRAVLDSKHFVKQWQFKGNNEDSFLRLVLQLRPSYNELVKELTRPLPPGELVVVSQYATVDELKLIVQCALRDTYCVMDKFVVRDIQIGEMEEKEYLNGVMCEAEQGMQVWVEGCGLDLDTKLRYQGGADDWTVDCGCGAKDDDGERMVACDVCHEWQHTRCNNIGDNEAAPPKFLCCRCSARKKY